LVDIFDGCKTFLVFLSTQI